MGNQEIRDAGLKVTVPRIKILGILEGSGDRHLSAEDVYRLLLETGEEIGLATVYRVLTQFESAGLVQRHNFEGGHSVFELNRGGHHDQHGRDREQPPAPTQAKQVTQEPPPHSAPGTQPRKRSPSRSSVG